MKRNRIVSWIYLPNHTLFLYAGEEPAQVVATDASFVRGHDLPLMRTGEGARCRITAHCGCRQSARHQRGAASVTLLETLQLFIYVCIIIGIVIQCQSALVRYDHGVLPAAYAAGTRGSSDGRSMGGAHVRMVHAFMRDPGACRLHGAAICRGRAAS
jgi:hypothetical protein